MPLTPNFSTSQTWGAPESINFTDTSTGSDGAITSRRIYMQTANGDFLVEDGTSTEYEVWAYADSTITLDVLTKDYALLITVQWLNSSNTVLYDKQYTLGFTLYNVTFDYELTQQMTGNPMLMDDNKFFQNKSDLRTNIDSGDLAIEFASDLSNSQQAYDRATELRTNGQYFFNANS